MQLINPLLKNSYSIYSNSTIYIVRCCTGSVSDRSSKTTNNIGCSYSDLLESLTLVADISAPLPVFILPL